MTRVFSRLRYQRTLLAALAENEGVKTKKVECLMVTKTETTTHIQGEQSKDHQPSPPHIRVYLVEDEALISECLRASLEGEEEIEIVGQATEAGAALREIETLGANLVLMDIGLPGMNGIEATRLLKKRCPDLPVVMLTSYRDEFLGDAIEAGASGYLLKTCTRQELVRAIKAATEGQAPIDPSLTSSLIGEMAQLRKAHRESLLSPRQLKILQLVASGLRYSEIAETIFLSLTTVNREMRNLFDRLGVNDAAHAVSKAHSVGLI